MAEMYDDEEPEDTWEVSEAQRWLRGELATT